MVAVPSAKVPATRVSSGLSGRTATVTPKMTQPATTMSDMIKVDGATHGQAAPW